jgi:threonine synthase
MTREKINKSEIEIPKSEIKMKFYSTNNTLRSMVLKRRFLTACRRIKVYTCRWSIPRLDDKFINNLDQYTLPEIAFHVAQNLLGDDIPADDLKAL